MMPGPGSYDVRYKTVEARSRKTTIASKLVEPIDKLQTLRSPGPMYKPRTAQILTHKPSYNIGGNTHQRPIITAIKSPGPTTYFSSEQFRPNSISISQR